MQLKNLKLRIGILQQEEKRIVWVEELGRKAVPSYNFASCAFYVPTLTEVCFALQKTGADTESATNYKLKISVGGNDLVEESFPASEASFRIYGSNTSTTGPPYKEVPLVAAEESIVVTILDVDRDIVLGEFNYRHLGEEHLPDGVPCGEPKLSGETWAFTTRELSSKCPRNETNGQTESKAAPALESDDDDIVCSTLESFKVSSPSSSPKKRKAGAPCDSARQTMTKASSSSLLNSFKPLLKPKVKAEYLGCEQAYKPPPPPIQLRRDAERKIADTRDQLKVSRRVSA
jgi:hypothetical protein